MSRFNRRASVDANQQAIVFALRAVGATVEFLHAVGGGCPDLLVGHRRRNFLLEVKNPATRHGRTKAGKTTYHQGTAERQRSWHSGWAGEVQTVWTVEDALMAISVVVRVA